MMNPNIRLDAATIARMRQTDVIRHYMHELRLSERQAKLLVATIHPVSRPVGRERSGNDHAEVSGLTPPRMGDHRA